MLAGCGDSSSISDPPPSAISNARSYPPDGRVSPNGYTRPTLAATTDTESVEYHNPKTGTTSDYDLEVDRDADGKIERINFPSGGWKEVDGDVTDNGDGTETYTDENGVEYTIKKPSDLKDREEKNGDDDKTEDDGSSG